MMLLKQFFLLHLDMNYLYGRAMYKSPPEKDFDFLIENQIVNFEVNSIPDDLSTGYILEVDIGYLSHLHAFRFSSLSSISRNQFRRSFSVQKILCIKTRH